MMRLIIKIAIVLLIWKVIVQPILFPPPSAKPPDLIRLTQ